MKNRTSILIRISNPTMMKMIINKKLFSTLFLEDDIQNHLIITNSFSTFVDTNVISQFTIDNFVINLLSLF